jgi:hypothetical protein
MEIEPDANDALIALHRKLVLIVTEYPGQAASKPFPAPPHLRAQLLKGAQMPFIRPVTPDELVAYVNANMPEAWSSW